MKLSSYKSTGREPYVFRAYGPADLIGTHADLIASAINPDERILYMLYAPIREAEATPFGLLPESASHAVAVTDRRFLISEDRHIGGLSATIRDIPFNRILCIEIGSALLLGWLTIQFIERNVIRTSSLSFTATGSHHFEAAVRAYRETVPVSTYGGVRADTQRPGIPPETPATQAGIIKSILVKKEKPIGWIHSSETWARKKWWKKKVCLSPDGTVLMTDRGLIYAVEETAATPGILRFGVNLCFVPIGSINSASHLVEEYAGIVRNALRLEMGVPPLTIKYDIPFPPEDASRIGDFVNIILRAASAGKLQCTL